MKKVIAVTWATVLVYLGGSFVAASFDIRDWSEYGRFLTVLLMAAAAICTFGYMAQND